MPINNEILTKTRKYYFIIDLAIMIYGILIFVFIELYISLSNDISIAFVSRLSGVNTVYYSLNFYYIFIKCVVGFIYMIKWIYNYYLKKNRNHPLILTIITVIIAIPCVISVGNQINNYIYNELNFFMFNKGLGFFIAFAIIGIAYWIRLIFNNWKNLYIKKIMYIIVLIVNLIITYYIHG
jgi:hypothetical protein